ncbi:MAG: diphthine synthase [Euryarchaeota archaeon]|nr:diphthine synthase [Euryarchaeota archaeon]|tara:strand:- start:544 stop:1365 length:822 start_codon:yes stop_codon:yes gene_type:complete
MEPEGLPPGLWLVGIGPGDLEHMTEKARSIARNCNKRYLEGYTAVLPEVEENRLEDVVGPWERLMRPSVESPGILIEEAREMPVALLVVGDPMLATTHIDLEARCSEEGVDFHVVPGMSATALAISLSGLQSYKFGRQVTLPYPYGEYLATSPLEMIISNQANGLHTLVLLDLDPTGMGFDPPKPMTPREAVSVLDKMVHRHMGSPDCDWSPEVPVKDWKGLLLSDVGTNRQNVVSGRLGDIGAVEGGWVHTLILPSEMSGNEKDAFQRRRLG